ncbi:MAG: alpha-amylase [Treponema sp.]|jgi:glycosidase|nr:alpha-amylase [Treponema sp.]
MKLPFVRRHKQNKDLPGITVCLEAFKNNAGQTGFSAAGRTAVMEFHIRREIREKHQLEAALFSLTGNVILANLKEVRAFAAKLNAGLPGSQKVKAGQLNAMGLIDEILHYVVALYREQVQSDIFEQAIVRLEDRIGRTGDMLQQFGSQFPPQKVYEGKLSVTNYLASSEGGESCRALSLEELLLLALANLNPAFKPFLFMFDDRDLAKKTVYPAALEELKAFFAELPPFGPDGQNLWDLLLAPILASPDSLSSQLDFMRKRWGLILGKFMPRLLLSLDIIKEEDKPSFFGPGPSEAYTYGNLENEYEKFSPDQEWMSQTVLMAKSTLVWLFQLSQKYKREIHRLDEIPDEELDELARRGFTGLWLIGLWERSSASKTIKQWTGNPEAAASAYSLYDYDIAGELGGWGSLSNLRERCFRRGIRLGSDMVPNHTGIDSRWIVEHPERFLQLPYPPFPSYNYNCGNLSGRDDITVQIEEHYFTRSDAAVVFKRIDNNTGETRYIYHGNDGTSMPWNDTAQIDFLNPEAREAVIRTIIGVCQQFSIVRFDAAMTLAKRHIQRLWYPEPGRGGDIASRSEHALAADEFNRRIPHEFWREVVDRCAAEAPHTLLLAEAFWMMEGYFVRTLGMHRVYNSAFMNMLKNEDNARYRATIKNTLEFDPEILKRFVNFMNNPDEETAVAQFGKGDKYFGIATLLVTMPGLPMFGHGQIEGFEEKYGMEYRRSYRDETPDQYLINRHEKEIFPLIKKRRLFSGSADFCLYDFFSNGAVNENVFAYSNRAQDESALVIYNNSYGEASGWIKESAIQKSGSRRDSLAASLGLHNKGDYFCLFREQRSGLTFIRSSKDMGERGLFAALKGYETQVFMEIREVKDDARGYWARLNHDLNGFGAVDIEAAKMDIILGELYYHFNELFKLYHSGSLPELKQPLINYVACARNYITGAGGLFEPWTGAQKQDGQKTASASSLTNDTDVPSAEEVWKQFLTYLERAGITKKAPKHNPEAAPPPDGGHDTMLPDSAFAYILLALTKSLIGKNAGGQEALSLVTHWQLDRKAREALCAQESETRNDSRGICEIMKYVLVRTGERSPINKFAAAKTAKELACSIILDNYIEEDFKRILGINIFDDVTWFNKEAFERTLLYAPLFVAIETGGDRAESVAKEFRRAEASSGYRLDKLLDALQGGSKSAGKTKNNAAQKKDKTV